MPEREHGDVKAAPGVFPDCGCHYTIDDDGIHFCPLHAQALAMRAELEKMLNVANAVAVNEASVRMFDWEQITNNIRRAIEGS